MQEQLTQREQEVFDLLIAGATLKEIAHNLNISFDTAATHQKNLYRKLDVHSVKELFAKHQPKTEAPDTSLAEQPFPCPFDLALNANPPWDWAYNFDPDVFQYNGEYYPSPFKLGKGNRLVEGDIYHVTCFFTVNTDADHIVVSFGDMSMGMEEDGFWTELSGYHQLGNYNLKANTRYNFSTKILVTRTASGASSVENKLSIGAGADSSEPPILTFYKFEAIKLPQPNTLRRVIPVPEQLTGQSVPYPLVFKLSDNQAGGWDYKLLYPDTFQYNGKWVASPFKLGEGNRIIEDDIFLVTLFFTSNVDIDYLIVSFIDTSIAADAHWTQLSAYLTLKKNIKAGTENNIIVKIVAIKTASGTSPAENLFVFGTGPKTKEQPTLTFTKFEIVKIA